jgi:hypothetical protein
VSNVAVDGARSAAWQCRSVLAHGLELRRGTARRELPLCARSAARGGDTGFANMYGAFEALPHDLRYVCRTQDPP